MCPQCHSENIEQTGKFDLTIISPVECQHDFECFECGCLFSIVYAPIATKIVERGELIKGELVKS